jgi:hypothetical protein
MSWKGIHAFAGLMTQMQILRGELIRMGSEKKALGTPEGNQDIRLGQILDKGKDAMKWDFARIAQEFPGEDSEKKILNDLRKGRSTREQGMQRAEVLKRRRKQRDKETLANISRNLRRLK